MGLNEAEVFFYRPWCWVQCFYHRICWISLPQGLGCCHHPSLASTDVVEINLPFVSGSQHLTKLGHIVISQWVVLNGNTILCFISRNNFFKQWLEIWNVYRKDQNRFKNVKKTFIVYFCLNLRVEVISR